MIEEVPGCLYEDDTGDDPEILPWYIIGETAQKDCSRPDYCEDAEPCGKYLHKQLGYHAYVKLQLRYLVQWRVSARCPFQVEPSRTLQP